jgi:polyphenol oxidase
MLKLEAANLRGLPGLKHGFFGRQGGVSNGLYASLNCGPGSNDVREHVTENRRRALAALAPGDLVTLYQIHSAEAVVVHRPWQQGEAPRADAMATTEPHIALGVLTADCAPVLFADADARIVGVAHAGWKGALGGVIEAAVALMEKLGARRTRIAAAIGPSISQKAYEVGEEFRAQFMAAEPANAAFFASGRAAHWQFDLPAYVQSRLVAAQIGTVVVQGACTYAREDDFFSYRRATHERETDYGRQISAIMLTE